MSLNLEEREFIDKYGFSVNDLYYSCIHEILKTGYVAYSVKELAYDISNKIFTELNKNIDDYTILYKLTNNTYWNMKIYTHNIAIKYEDFYFNFKMRWTEGSLKVIDWDITAQEEIENDIDYTDIEEAIKEEEEEL